jgi:hypothetical protein
MGFLARTNSLERQLPRSLFCGYNKPDKTALMARKENLGIRKVNSPVRKIKRELLSEIIFFNSFSCWRSWFIMEEVEGLKCINIEKNGSHKTKPRKYLSSINKKKVK